MLISKNRSDTIGNEILRVPHTWNNIVDYGSNNKNDKTRVSNNCLKYTLLRTESDPVIKI